MHEHSELRPLLERLAHEADAVYDNIRDLPVTPTVTVDTLRRDVEERFDLDAPRSAMAIFDDASTLLRNASLHVTHPRYFGLFNPAVIPSTVAADALVALHNPQTGGWSHNPAANEMERVTLRHLARMLGFDADAITSHFTSGGNEANHTAVIAALAHTFPEWTTGGLRALPARPTIYLSTESHHSFVKVARATGLGTAALREISTDDALRMSVPALVDAIEHDLAKGDHPFMVVATAGTTGSGAIDPISALADVCQRFGLWMHVDAAWGGSACLVPRLRPLLAGAERADSLTWDAHKWLSVPLGAGMIFCRHGEAFARAFGVHTPYVPDAAEGTVDLYKTSLQWSRRFIGLKVLFALAEHGRDRIAALIDNQSIIGDRLRNRLTSAGWTIVNDTTLPLVCFSHPSLGSSHEETQSFVSGILARRRVWISDVSLPRHGWVLRACITSFRTDDGDLDVLMEELQQGVASLSRR